MYYLNQPMDFTVYSYLHFSKCQACVHKLTQCYYIYTYNNKVSSTSLLTHAHTHTHKGVTTFN